MRKFFGLFVLAIVSMCVSTFTGCVDGRRHYYADDPYDDYQVITSPSGVRQVVVMQNGSQMLMDYVLFQSLINQSGGYNNVRSYYSTHQSAFRPYVRQQYSNWNTSRYSPPKTTRITSNNTNSASYNNSSAFRKPTSVTSSSAWTQGTNKSGSSAFRSPSSSSSSSAFRSSSSSSSFRSSSSSSSSSAFRPSSSSSSSGSSAFRKKSY